jgi:hypothetical protein
MTRFPSFSGTKGSGIISAGFVACACLASLGAVAHASTSVLVNDQFSGSAGTYLSGRTPDTADLSGATWVQYGTTSNNGGSVITPNTLNAISLTGSGSAAFPTYSGSGSYADMGAAINFNADTSATAGDLSLQATINAADNGAEWLAVGFGPSNPTNNYGPWAGGPWVLVKHTGEVQFFATGGTSAEVIDDTAAENTTGSHTIQLTYDPATTTVTLSVDGSAVTGGSYTYGGTNAAVPASFGSVFVDDRYKFSYSLPANATDYGTFSNLMVTGTPAATPEPAAAGVLCAGLIGGLLALRRRRAN